MLIDNNLYNDFGYMTEEQQAEALEIFKTREEAEGLTNAECIDYIKRNFDFYPHAVIDYDDMIHEGLRVVLRDNNETKSYIANVFGDNLAESIYKSYIYIHSVYGHNDIYYAMLDCEPCYMDSEGLISYLRDAIIFNNYKWDELSESEILDILRG